MRLCGNIIAELCVIMRLVVKDQVCETRKISTACSDLRAADSLVSSPGQGTANAPRPRHPPGDTAGYGPEKGAGEPEASRLRLELADQAERRDVIPILQLNAKGCGLER